MDKTTMIKEIMKIVKQTNKKVSELSPSIRDAVDVDMQKTLKSMAYTQIDEIIQKARKEARKEVRNEKV